MPLVTKPHSVLSPGEAIDGDVRCQSCIQSSTTLAHACLLIRRGDTALAGHILNSLEQAKNSPFRDIIAYFRAWIEMEARDFAKAKSELLSLLQQQPGDSVALSLLQACMVLELRERGALTATPETPAAVPPPAAKSDTPASIVNSIPDSEMTPYQAVAEAPQTAFVLWKGTGEFRVAGNQSLAPLAGILPAVFPGAMREAVARLDGGTVQKVCFSFQELTVAVWHGSEMHAGLVTGPIQQAQLAMVRIEKAFLKRAPASAA